MASAPSVNNGYGVLVPFGHRHGESAESSNHVNQVRGDRVSLNLLGDGYIEAIGEQYNRQIDELLQQAAQEQEQANEGCARCKVRSR